MTLYETVGQLQVFVWMLAAGALMGAWYAVTALLRRLLEARTWLGLCADAAFGLGAGAIFCLACDLIARTAVSPVELAISSVTAVFGAPVVIAIMIRRKRRS